MHEPLASTPHLCLVAQQPEGNRVWDGEGEEAEVEGRVVKLEVDAHVPARGRVGQALAEQRQTGALPAGPPHKRTEVGGMSTQIYSTREGSFNSWPHRGVNPSRGLLSVLVSASTCKTACRDPSLRLVSGQPDASRKIASVHTV